MKPFNFINEAQLDAASAIAFSEPAEQGETPSKQRRKKMTKKDEHNETPSRGRVRIRDGLVPHPFSPEHLRPESSYCDAQSDISQNNASNRSTSPVLAKPLDIEIIASHMSSNVRKQQPVFPNRYVHL